VYIEDIIQGCKQGNRKSQDALVQKFAPGLLALCLRYTSDREQAKDALQECFINVFTYINGYHGGGSFEGWLKRIAVNCAIGYHKKYNTLLFTDEAEVDRYSHTNVPEVYSDMGVDEIMGLLHLLPESLYLVFNLAVVEGYNHSEIAEALGITESTSRAALSKARNKLVTLISNQNTHNALAKIG
jgi:RNA polymerase sigma factor (sigma-70 family)